MKQPFEGSEGYINHGHDVLDEDNALGKRRRFNNGDHEGCEDDCCGIAVEACDCCGAG